MPNINTAKAKPSNKVPKITKLSAVLFTIKLLASFVYTLLHTTKETVIVTNPNSGAEVIPALKGGIVIICAFAVMVIYAKACNHFKRNVVFNLMLMPFLLFFVLYGFVLYPYQDYFTPTQTCAWLTDILGAHRNHWICVYRYWMHSVLFVLSELWGGLVINVLFWGFANQLSSIKDAAKFYVLYTAGGQLGTLIAGGLTMLINYLSSNYTNTIKIIMLLCILASSAILLIYAAFNHNTKPEQLANNTKTRLSLKESLLCILKSPYLGCIAFMVIGYSLSVNLIEVSWKAILKLQYPNQNDYHSFTGSMQLIIGILSLMVTILIGKGGLIQKLGWYTSAQLTPIAIGATSLLFFIGYLAFPNLLTQQGSIAYFSVNLGATTIQVTPLFIMVILGAIHSITFKTMKYCLFDTTKEIAYIPLNPEEKTKGKAAIDLVGARFGKSGSSWLQLFYLDFIAQNGSILEMVPFLIPLLSCVLVIWPLSVHYLNKQMTQSLDEGTNKRKLGLV